MKWFHLSDLHYGKQLHGYDLQEEQHWWNLQIAEYVRQEKPDAILVSGDIYDKSVPSAGAMTLLEEFFILIGQAAKDCGKSIPILLIAGNHDSAERLRYAGRFLESHQIYISTLPPVTEEEHLRRVTLEDSYGKVHFYLLPFTKPGMVRQFLPEEAVTGVEAVVKSLIEREDIDWSARNVLLSHQFYVTGGTETKRCDSEQMDLTVGGLDAVHTSVVESFDYVALGHIHSPQWLVPEKVRYCGTPMKYSVSEAGQKKSITVVELKEKQDGCRSYLLPLNMQRDVRSVRGTLREILDQVPVEGRVHDYISITLTDEEMLEQPKAQLELYFDSILEVILDNSRTRQVLEEEVPDLKEMSPLDAFGTFFQETAGREMNEEEADLLREILQEISEKEAGL